MNSNVSHPAHYVQWPVEAIYLTEREGFLLGNVIKYALRAGVKAGSTYGEDMAKARWYARRYVDNSIAGDSLGHIYDALDSLRTRFDDAAAYLKSRREDTTEMCAYLQDQLAAIYAQVEKEVCAEWDAT